MQQHVCMELDFLDGVSQLGSKYNRNMPFIRTIIFLVWNGLGVDLFIQSQYCETLIRFVVVRLKK